MDRSLRYKARRLSFGVLVIFLCFHADKIQSSTCDVLSIRTSITEYTQTERLLIGPLDVKNLALEVQILRFLRDPSLANFYPEVKSDPMEQAAYQEKKAREYLKVLREGFYPYGNNKRFVLPVIAINPKTNQLVGTMHAKCNPGGMCLIKYAINPNVNGEKYGKELVGAVVSQLLAMPRIKEIKAIPLPDNLPSMKILEGLGFKRHKDDDIDSFGVHRAQMILKKPTE